MKPVVPDGLTVKFWHERFPSYYGIEERTILTPFFPKELREQKITPHAKGGQTVARLYDVEGNLVAEGVATCHENDNYNRRIGRDIALGRALKALPS